MSTVLPEQPVTPVPPATAAARRIVPALVGGSPLFVEDPGWCTLDHIRADEATLDEVYHSGESAVAVTPDTGIAGDAQLMLFAQLNQDPWSGMPERRQAMIVVIAGGYDARLNAAQAEEYADELIAFAEQIRAMARTIGSQA